MPLIKSISGIRGTIGGKAGDNLSPLDVVKFTAAFGVWLRESSVRNSIVVGRDARISGPMISQLVCNTLVGLGFDVIDLGLSTTPTVEMAVVKEHASGGIIITASHNPKEWNALKLLNEEGEFISQSAGERILTIVEEEAYSFADVNHLGKLSIGDNYVEYHIKKILDLDLVDVQAIRNANFSVSIDCVNSSGAISVPPLLQALGVGQVDEIHCTPNGHFPHDPEPLPKNLSDISNRVIDQSSDLGIVVDPDVDRLCFVCEDGSFFGEEYTLVAVADYVLSHTKGDAVSNLSSTRVLKDVCDRYGTAYHTSKVGEVNVVKKMKETGALIGGEGNGGVIYPELHYGRDALVGIALFLSHLAKTGKKMSELRNSYPNSFIAKEKVVLKSDFPMAALLNHLEEQHMDGVANREDGLRLDFAEGWVHVRKSNTEPIIRIYAEASDEESAKRLSNIFVQEINKF